MRIVSLLASGTEIVVGLGAGDLLQNLLLGAWLGVSSAPE